MTVVAAILWFCHAMLQPLGLQVLAQLLTVFTIAGLVAVPLVRAIRFWGVPGRSREVNKSRAAVMLAALAVLLVATLVTPLPHRITVPAVLQLQDAHRVFVSVAGRLTWSVEPGTEVRQGDVLGRLENPDLVLEIARLQGQREVLRSQLQSLKSRSAQQTNRGVRDAGSEIPTTEQALADIENRLRKREEEKQRLTLTAPSPGPPAPARADTKAATTNCLPGQVSRWTEPTGMPSWRRARCFACLAIRTRWRRCW